MTAPYNGMPAGDLPDARWYKSPASSPQGNCVELAVLPGEQVAMRNSRHPDGPVLILTKAQVKELIECMKHGLFDHLVVHREPRPQDPPDATHRREALK